MGATYGVQQKPQPKFHATLGLNHKPALGKAERRFSHLSGVWMGRGRFGEIGSHFHPLSTWESANKRNVPHGNFVMQASIPVVHFTQNTKLSPGPRASGLVFIVVERAGERASAADCFIASSFLSLSFPSLAPYHPTQSAIIPPPSLPLFLSHLRVSHQVSISWRSAGRVRCSFFVRRA